MAQKTDVFVNYGRKSSLLLPLFPDRIGSPFRFSLSSRSIWRKRVQHESCSQSLSQREGRRHRSKFVRVAAALMDGSHGCQMTIARFLDPVCLALRASGLWLHYATLQNLIPSFPWIVPPRPPPWHNPRKGRDQILPSGNLANSYAIKKKDELERVAKSNRCSARADNGSAVLSHENFTQCCIEM